MPPHTWTPEELADIAAAAAHAPSVLNSKPWSLRLHGTEIILGLDPTNDLASLDPSGRQRLISCGAAVTNIGIAVRALGWRPHLVTFPSVRNRRALASITPGRRAHPGTEVLRLRQVVNRRYSNREQFLRASVPARLIGLLERAGNRDGVRVRQIPPSDIVEAATDLRIAEDEFRSDRMIQSDVDRWIRHQLVPRQRGGIDAADLSVNLCPGAGVPRPGVALPAAAEIVDGFEHGAILALTTAADTDADHLTAGMALQDVLLAATDHGIATSVIVSALEKVRARDSLTTWPGLVQLLIRVGWPVRTTWHNADDHRLESVQR